MKTSFSILFVASVAFLAGCSVVDMSRVSVAGVKAIQAMTVSDEQVNKYTREFIAKSDKDNALAAADDKYAVRLDKITAPFNNRDGLNIRVYKNEEVNAFATADGSIRVYSGLMDIMTDEEILGVIGHEIGHVMNRDTRDAFKNALLVSAVRDGISSTTGKVGELTASQFGDLGEKFLESRYSQKQEYAADDYGYGFLEKSGVNPWAMCMALEKLKQLEQQAGGNGGAVNQLFSTHPDIASRTIRMSVRARQDDYKKPGDGGDLYIKSGVPSPAAVAASGNDAAAGLSAAN